MKLLKPNWVSHEGQPIFSLDLHPDGSRFATGGQGKDSGVVVIWNMSPVRSKSDEMDPSVPRTLCELTNHLSCVNCVRWSLDGKWLASGGDDAIVMIWQIKRQGAVSGGFGSTLSTIHEQWGCVHMLRGHSSDVLDLSWSPDRRHLASCSVDNTIIIWNAKDLPQKVAAISGHNGMVKGLSWDPVGKFIASQSDDRSIRVWRTSDWKEVRKITEPFKECSGTTHVLRLNWSPDGCYIVSAHSLNNEGPTAQIIERGGDWKLGMDFVGHRKAVEVVRFNPHLFVKSGSKSKDNHGCLALGSKDRSLSIWLTNQKRPLVVIHDLFKDSVLDLSWSKSGYELLVCSTDGSIAFLSFSSKELGLRLSKHAFDNLYLQMYGFKRAEVKSTADTSMVLIENPEMLKLHPTAASENASGPPPGDSSLLATSMTSLVDAVDQSVSTSGVISTSTRTSTTTTVQKQVETRTKDGKRRITPITLTTEPIAAGNVPLPFTSLSSSSPKRMRVVASSSSASTLGVTPDRATSVEKGDGTASKKSASGSEHSTPKSCPDFPDNEDSGEALPKPISFEALSPKSLKDPLAAGSSGVGKSSSSPSLKATSSTSKTAKKRTADELAPLPSDIVLPKAKKLKKKGVQSLVLGGSASHSPVRTSTPQKHTISGLATASDRYHSKGGAQLPVPKLESSFSVVVLDSVGRGRREGDEGGRSEASAVVTVENNPDGTHSTISYSCAEGGSGIGRSDGESWSASLSSPCLLAAASRVVTAAACQDRSLSLLSTQTGRTLSAKLSLPDTCHFLRAESHYVMAALCSGHVTVWDVGKLRSVINLAPFCHLLMGVKHPPDEILLTQNGLPVLKINSSCFIYNTDMEAWMSLGGSKEVSEIGNFDVGSVSNFGSGMTNSSLEHLQQVLFSEGDPPRLRERSDSVGAMLRQVHSKGVSSLNVRSTGGGAETEGEGLSHASAFTVMYLESQISRSSCLGSPGEYRQWCLSYVQYLVKNSMESRLREFCGQFSTPLSLTPSSSSPACPTLGGVTRQEGDVVLGFTKSEMLREFMGVVAQNHKLQRLYSELKEAIDRQAGSL